MIKKRTKKTSQDRPIKAENTEVEVAKAFHLDFLTSSQKLAWGAYQQHDMLFLLGAAGTGKSHLATAFGVTEILQKTKKKIILSRPIVESGESLGFLPGTFDEKVNPFMIPLFECLDKMCGPEGRQREMIKASVEVVPIAYMRGRSQPLDSFVLTPNGYVSMGSLVIGSRVIGSNGKPTAVTGIFPQGELDVFRVTFTDGVSVECSADHLWHTTTLYERRHKRCGSIRTTSQIAESIKHSHAYNHQIPIADPVEFEGSNAELPLDPYLLGILLGDGNLSESPCPTFCTVDKEIVEHVSTFLPADLSLKLAKVKDDYRAPVYRISGCGLRPNAVKTAIIAMELIGKLSHDKFIPEQYKLSSIKNRLALLRGLMDADGTCYLQDGGRKPRVQYFSTSKRLAADVAFLVHSLGGTASVRKRTFKDDDWHLLRGRKVRHNHPVWTVGIRMTENPFMLTRKSELFEPLKPLRAIRSVEKIGKKPCQCIQVSAEDRLYVTEHCIVTHNTFNDSIFILDEAQNCTKQQIILAMTRLGKNSKMIITGDPNQTDLPGDPAIIDIVSKIRTLSGVGVIHFKENAIVRHPLVGKILTKLK